MVTLNLREDCKKVLSIHNPYKYITCEIRVVPKEFCDNRDNGLGC